MPYETYRKGRIQNSKHNNLVPRSLQLSLSTSDLGTRLQAQCANCATELNVKITIVKLQEQ